MSRHYELSRLAHQITSRFIQFALKLAAKESVRIFPSSDIDRWLYVDVIIGEKTREGMIKRLCFALAALIRDLKDDQRTDKEIEIEAASFSGEAEQFYDENADLFAEVALEKQS